VLALALLLAWAPVATGQERPERAWSSPILQVGMADCGGATGCPEDKAGFLLTTDVSVLRHPGFFLEAEVGLAGWLGS